MQGNALRGAPSEDSQGPQKDALKLNMNVQKVITAAPFWSSLSNFYFLFMTELCPGLSKKALELSFLLPLISYIYLL